MRTFIHIASVLVLLIPAPSWSFFNILLMRRTVSLEVPIELLDTSLDADVTSKIIEISRTTLDTTDYDGGVSYSFEIVVANFDSVSRDVDLLDPSDNVVATIPVPVSANETRRRITFTPVSGASNYRLRIPAVTAKYDLHLTAARIFVTQVNATKTKLYYPLLTDTNPNSQDVVTEIDASTGPYWYVTESLSVRWLKDSDNLATVAAGSPWTLEAVIASSAAVGTARVALLQAGSTTTVVTGSTATTTATTPTLVSASFADDAVNFTNNGTFQVKMYHTDSGTDSRIYKAGIWVKLVNLSKGSVLYRVARGGNDNSTVVAKYRPFSRQMISTTAFSHPTIYYEDTSKCSIASCATTSLYSHGTSDSGTTSPTLVTSSTNTPSTSYSRTRSTALTVTSGNRFFGGYTRTSGTFTWVNGAIVVNFSR